MSSFQVQSTVRSTLQGTPVRMATARATRVSRAPLRVQALNLADSATVIQMGAITGFGYAGMVGGLKAAWTLRYAVTEPGTDKPLTATKKQVLIYNEAGLYGLAGTLVGLSAALFTTQGGLSPMAGWLAGSATGLPVFMAGYLAVKQAAAQGKPGAAPKAAPSEAGQKDDGSVSESLDGYATDSDSCDEDACELRSYDDNDKN